MQLFSRAISQNLLGHPTLMANIFEDFEPPSKKFLARPLMVVQVGTLLLSNDKNVFIADKVLS